MSRIYSSYPKPHPVRQSLSMACAILALLGLTLTAAGCPNFFKGKPKPVNPPSGGNPSPGDGYLTQSPQVTWDSAQANALRSLIVKTSVPSERVVSETAREISVRITLDFEKPSESMPKTTDLVGLWTGNVAARSMLEGRDQVLVLATTLTDYPCREKTQTIPLGGLCARRVLVIVPKSLESRVSIVPLNETLLERDNPEALL